jgi:sugar phosphate isomerase/epimerase
VTADDKFLAFLSRVEDLIDAASARGIKAERFRELCEQVELEISAFGPPLDQMISNDAELKNRMEVLFGRIEKLFRRASTLSELPQELQKYVADRSE